METRALNISSSSFRNEALIPPKHTCDGAEKSPALHIEGIPDKAVSLALIMEDPDAPKGIYDHWIVWNIDPVADIEEGGRPGISGRNSSGKTGYKGPCPPNGSHRYYIYIFALDTDIDLPEGASKDELSQSMMGHIIAQGSIMGRYERSGT